MIISLSGRKGSGKTTLASVCVDKGYTLLNFGDELKNLLCRMMNITSDYLSEHKEDVLNIDLMDYKDFLKKEINLDESQVYLLNKKIKSYRELLQYIGTEIIRTIEPDWHIKRIDHYIKSKDLQDKNLVFADTRFRNELEYIKSLNGICWYILSPYNTRGISNHVSETELTWRHFTNVLANKNNISTIINWGRYVKDFNKNHLKMDYKLPPTVFPTVDEDIKRSMIIYNGVLYIRVNEKTNRFIENLECVLDDNSNYYIVKNPYIIESVKIYF